MAFQYRARKPETIAKRAEAKGAGDFENFLKDEFPIYSPKDDENYIRILPPTWDDPEHYGLTLHVHYGIGPDRGAVLCPNKMYGHKCPICEARVKAERAQADEEIIKEMKVTTRVLVWLLDMDKDDDKGPQLWAMPFTVDRDICKISRDKRSGETYIIDHPDDGYNVSFDKTGKQRNTKYSGYVLAKRPSSVDQEWLDYVEAHPLPSVLIDRSYDDIKALFEGGVPDEEEDSVRPSRGERPRIADRDDERPSRSARNEAADERPARRRIETPTEDERPSRRASERDDREPPEEEQMRRKESDERPSRSRLAREIDDEIPFEGSSKRGDPPHDRETGELTEEQPRSRSRLVYPEETAASNVAMSAKERAAALREKYQTRR
jgi:hypothetical protein